MDKGMNRRKKERIALNSIVEVMRMCDIAVESGDGDVDVTIKDISPQGMGIRVNESLTSEIISQGDEVFIRGCIFNDKIGFLSSQKASVVWKNEKELGLRFTPELDINLDGIREMLSDETGNLLQ